MRLTNKIPFVLRSIIVPTLLCIILFLTGCSQLDCERGNGDAVRKDLSLESFHGIVVEGAIDVHLGRADVQRIEAEGQPNLLALLKTEVKNGVLHVGMKKCFMTTAPLSVHIAIPVIDHITIHGSGDVNSKDRFVVPDLSILIQGSGSVHMAIEAQQVKAIVEGSGDIALEGQAQDFEAEVMGSGDIDALGLVVENAKAVVMGSGDILLQATGHLEASITGSGDIKHRGKPLTMDRKVTGSGDVEQVP